MSARATIPAPSPAGPARMAILAATHGPAVLVVALAFWLTIPYTQADSPGYASEIVQYRDVPLLSEGNVLWEFGHLVWRPIGWALFQLASPSEAGSTPWEAALLALRILIWVNLATALFTVLLWHSLALRASGSRAVAFAVAVGLAFTHSFLLYAQTGNSYVPGLCFSTLALWLIVETLERPSPGKLLPLAAGCSMAIAALLWFPYVFSVPGVAAAAFFWRSPKENAPQLSGRYRLALAALAFCSFAVVLTTVYGTTGWARGFRTIPQFAGWVSDSSHGWSQSLNVVRVATGLPRSFINLDMDGVLWKRFLFRDPYAPISAWDLVWQAGLWKLATFYMLSAAIVWSCFRSAVGRRSLTILAASAAPLLLFAVILFEPGSPERYFPAFAFLSLAIAGAIGAYPSNRLATLTILAALAITAATNLYFMSPYRVSRGVDETTGRLAAFKGGLGGESAVFALGSKDAACNFRRDYPFHPFNNDGGVPIIDLVEIANERVDTWREEFAQKALQAWDSGRDVWVTKRAWAKSPLPEWYWAEGDDPRISWADLPAFFQPLETGGETEGDDGFRRIEPSEANRLLLGRVTAASTSEGSP